MLTSTILSEIAQKTGKTMPQNVKEVPGYIKKVCKDPVADVWNSFSPNTLEYLRKQSKSIKTDGHVELPTDLKVVKEKSIDEEWKEQKKNRRKKAQPEEADDAQFLNIELEQPPNYTVYPVVALIGMYAKKEIDIPPYQRDFIWKRNERRLFIDSLLGRVPIPPLFLCVDPADKKGKYNLVDGQQRLLTMKLFMENGERVNGKRYEQYSEEMRSRFDHTAIQVTQIRAAKAQQPAIFRRINIASRTLKDIELRWSTYFDTDMFQAIRAVARKNEVWKSIYGDDNRMSGTHALLRGLALHASFQEYNSSMTKFLDAFCEKMDEYYPDKLQLSINLDNIVMAMNDSMDKQTFKFGTIKQKVNPAMTDAMLNAGLSVVEKYPSISIGELSSALAETRETLLKDKEMLYSLEVETTGKDSIFNRMIISQKIALERAKAAVA